MTSDKLTYEQEQKFKKRKIILESIDGVTFTKSIVGYELRYFNKEVGYTYSVRVDFGDMSNSEFDRVVKDTIDTICMVQKREMLTRIQDKRKKFKC